jgi:SAM-dependent methyltransferase
MNGFSWFRCDTCHTTQKVLTPQEYTALNPSYDPGEFLDSCNRQQIEGFLDVPGAQRVISDAVSRHLADRMRVSPAPAFLDVGCGVGRYLIAAQRLGFEVLGFEPSRDHARVATQRFGLPVIADYFSPALVTGKSFDLIVLSHVIEHILDPKCFIQTLVSVLAPRGVLIIITPNNESLLARFVGKAWPMLKPVDHVSMIGASAYKYFDLGERSVAVNHSTSEYAFEFAAASLSAVKSLAIRSLRGRSTHLRQEGTEVRAPLRGLGVKARLLRVLLGIISMPVHILAIATDRQACLKSILVRKL